MRSTARTAQRSRNTQVPGHAQHRPCARSGGQPLHAQLPHSARAAEHTGGATPGKGLLILRAFVVAAGHTAESSASTSRVNDRVNC